MTALEVLQMIANSGAAMSALRDSSCTVIGAEPPTFAPDGTLAVDADGHVINPGSPAKTLGDLVMEALADG